MWAAYNMRFYESGGVTPHEKQYKITSASPAKNTVTPAFIKPPPDYAQADKSAVEKGRKLSQNSEEYGKKQTLLLLA